MKLLKSVLILGMMLFGSIFVVYFGAIFYAHEFNPNSLKIDECLDEGGVWDYKQNICQTDSSDIKNIVTKFYSSNYFTQGFGSTQTSHIDFSQDLANAINQAIEKENISIKNTPKGDKPELIEGNVFVSLYEGATKVDVISVNINKDIATVNIKATYDLTKYGVPDHNAVSWNDEVILKNENGLWKIDNILYKAGENIRVAGEKPDLKSFLKLF